MVAEYNSLIYNKFFILRGPGESLVARLVSGRSSVRIRQAAPLLKSLTSSGFFYFPAWLHEPRVFSSELTC